MSPAVLEWCRSFSSSSIPDSVEVVPIVRISELSCSMTPENNNVPGEAHVSTFLKETGGVSLFNQRVWYQRKKKGGDSQLEIRWWRHNATMLQSTY